MFENLSSKVEYLIVGAKSILNVLFHSRTDFTSIGPLECGPANKFHKLGKIFSASVVKCFIHVLVPDFESSLKMQLTLEMEKRF
jgi:hypothetical protein